MAGLSKKGLQIRFSDTLAETERRGALSKFSPRPAGWYIFVWRNGRWHAVLDLQFYRAKDAHRGAENLIANGLDSHGAMVRAGMAIVKQVATEFLQW